MDDKMRSTPGLRTAMVGIAVFFIALFVVNTFVGSSPSSVDRAAQYFSREEIDRGLEYSYQLKLLNWCGVGLQLALLTSLVCTTWGRRLTDLFDRCTGRRWLLTLLMVGATYFLVSELLALPLGVARLEHARAWNMTDRTMMDWFIDRAKGIGLSAVLGAVQILGLYGLIYFFPRRWWLIAAGGATILGVLYALFVPELIQPLFNQFTPLDDPYLSARVQALARRAGLDVDKIYVMDASRQGRHTNAYFTGFGATQRIVLYDTLVQSHSGVHATSTASLVGLLGQASGGGPLLAASEVCAARAQGDDEMETILAHEIGHWRHHHIIKGIVLASVGGLFGMFLLSRILRWAKGRRPFCLTGPTDPAGLPLILLLFMLAEWLSLPVQNGIGRYFERQADTASLELADKPEAFIEAEKRLARDNRSNVAPAPFNVWMFSTHPPTVDRIEMAEKWRKREP